MLSAAELRHFDEHGYLVLRGAVPRTQCAAARAAIWDYLGASPDDPASWYQPHPGKRGLMLQFSDHPALEENRHSAHIRHAYQQLYGTGTGIYASIDKVSFNPPETPQHRFLGSALHWDVSLQQPIPFKLQGMLYLSDCPAQHGAFHCVPGFQHRMAELAAASAARPPAARMGRRQTCGPCPSTAWPAISSSGTRPCPIAPRPTAARRRAWCST